MTDTVKQAPSEAQAARARRCPLCEKPPGVPCQAKPEADHLARFLDAFAAGKLVRFRLIMDTLVPVPGRQVADAVPVAG